VPREQAEENRKGERNQEGISPHTVLFNLLCAFKTYFIFEGKYAFNMFIL